MGTKPVNKIDFQIPSPTTCPVDYDKRAYSKMIADRESCRKSFGEAKAWNWFTANVVVLTFTKNSSWPALGKAEREFGASTRELLEMTEWLTEGGCEKVAMESTASYWKPLYNISETAGLSAMVVNAQHMKAVPGRKTDTSDAEWIADLL